MQSSWISIVRRHNAGLTVPNYGAIWTARVYLDADVVALRRIARTFGYNGGAEASEPLTDTDYLRTETPLGIFVLAGRGSALVGGWFEGQKYFPDISAERGWREVATPVLNAAKRQLQDYFRGERTKFELPLAPDGTVFQRRVWTALGAVACGETTTYAALARALGKPDAFHAVGAAVGRNPISIIIPCHRALGSDGSLTGYAGGLARKRWLLDHERHDPSLFD